jgi:hypothetical protein
LVPGKQYGTSLISLLCGVAHVRPSRRCRQFVLPSASGGRVKASAVSSDKPFDVRSLTCSKLTGRESQASPDVEALPDGLRLPWLCLVRAPWSPDPNPRRRDQRPGLRRRAATPSEPKAPSRTRCGARWSPRVHQQCPGPRSATGRPPAPAAPTSSCRPPRPIGLPGGAGNGRSQSPMMLRCPMW